MRNLRRLNVRGLVFGVVSVVASAWAVAPAAHADAIVVNGNFDADSPPPGTAPTGWTFTPASSGSDFFVGAGPGFGALSTPNSANFGGTGSFDDTISQVLTTVPGQTYTLEFSLAHASTDSVNDFSASWDGSNVLSLTNASIFNYTQYTYTVVATTDSTTLAFSGRENPSWYSLDNVSVTSAPEPGSFIMLGIGLVGLLIKRR